MRDVYARDFTLTAFALPLCLFSRTVKLDSHRLAPGSSCVAALPSAKLAVSSGKPALERPPVPATTGAVGGMPGHWLFAVATMPVGEIDDANAGHVAGSGVPVSGLMLYKS